MKFKLNTGRNPKTRVDETKDIELEMTFSRCYIVRCADGGIRQGYCDKDGNWYNTKWHSPFYEGEEPVAICEDAIERSPSGIKADRPDSQD